MPKPKSTNSFAIDTVSLINYSTREINCKLVYYGPGLGGKTNIRSSLETLDDVDRKTENGSQQLR